jgi:GTP cyclohydrolase I
MTTQISEVILNRINEAGGSYFANDNISEYIQEGELDLLISEVASKMDVVLRALLIDIDNDHNTQETGKRLAKMWINEVFSGRYQPMPDVRYFPNAKELNSMYVTGPITIRSCCSHHLVPFIGEAFIGIIPGKEVVGLSKFNRLISWVFSRPQIQEEAIMEIADIIERELKPEGLGIVVTAKHHCIDWRGVKDKSVFTTCELRGSMFNQSSREEFMSLINLNKG